MSDEIEWVIPPSLIRNLESVPTDRPVVLLLRHSVRGPLPLGDAGNNVPITEAGWNIARELGQMLGARLKTLHSSPVPRCVQTAQALKDGAAVHIVIRTNRLLGDPGVYVLDGESAWTNWVTLGHEEVMRHLVSESDALPGMAKPDESARFLVHHMLSMAGETPGLHVFVTHDSLITATVARLQGARHGPSDWPWFLEGALFWRDSKGVHVAYRESESLNRRARLCELNESEVIEFARREIAETVGLDCDARFFLAGGAFKSLLTGRPPRDLDFWAPSPLDRDILLDHLQKRGAVRLPSSAFADVFEIRGRVVEVPYKTEPGSLQDRLNRFDIALSAVGVEYQPGGGWSAMIHHLALQSVVQREVLLLEPLANWKYALATLERMRRYAFELGFCVSSDGEAAIWELYYSQPSDVRQRMLEHFEEVSIGAYGVAEETRHIKADGSAETGTPV